MNRPITSSLTSNASKTSRPEAWIDRGAAHYAALLGIGVILAGIHQAWNLKLGLPGHYGLIWMAGIVASRHWSQATWAATLCAVGYIAGTAGFTGFAQHGLTQAPAYAISTIVLDGLWRVCGPRFARTPVAALAGGLAFLMKPLVMLALASFAGLTIGSLRHGNLFPLVTHFAFGLTGAVLGTLAWRAAHPDTAAAG